MSPPQSVVEVEQAPLSRSRPAAAMGWMLLAYLLFAVMNLVAKSAMRELPWHEVAAGRAAFGAITIFLFARARGVSLAVHDKKTQWMRTFAGIGSLMCGFYSLSRLPLGDAVTIGSLCPIFIALASRRALGERTGAGLAVAVVLGFCGVALLAGAQLHAGSGALFAIGIGVLGAAFACAAMLFLRRLGPSESPEGVSLHFVGVSALVMIVFGLGRQVVPSPWALASLVAAGLSGGLAQVAMTKAYGLDRAARVGALGYSGVVFAQILGVVFLAEIPTGRQLGGAALVLLSGAFLAIGALFRRDALVRRLRGARAMIGVGAPREHQSARAAQRGEMDRRDVRPGRAA
jgi:drug/metabolite transporter (DMT)-like permease